MKPILAITLFAFAVCSQSQADEKKPLLAKRLEDRIAEIFKHLDSNSDGSLSYTEFAAAKVLEDKKESEIKDLFREFDEKRDQKLTLEEFTKGLKEERKEQREDALPRQWRLRR